MAAPAQGTVDMISFLNSDAAASGAPEMYCEMDDCVGNASLRCPACKLAMCMSCHSIHSHPVEAKEAVDIGKGPKPLSAAPSARKEPSDRKKVGSPGVEEKNKPRSVFEPYWDLARVEADLQAGRLKKGTLEVPESKKDLATFRATDGTVLQIMGWEHRNRSLDGDTVAIQFQPNDESRIVYNFTPVAGREFMGKLALSVDLNGPMVAFSCADIKFPPFLITLPASCVELLKTHMVRPAFKLKATQWEATSKWPYGEPASEEELEKTIREKSKQEKAKLAKIPLAPAGSAGIVRKTYKPHVTEEEMKAGIEQGEFFEGTLRIVSPRDAFVTVKGLDVDVYLEGRKARNRAYDGDKVVIRIAPQTEWKIITEEKRVPPFRRGTFDGEEGRFDFPEEFHPARALAADNTPLPQPVGNVVYILHRPIDPVKVGYLDVSTAPDKVALFKPLDLKAPFAVLPKRDWPKEFQNVQSGANTQKHFYVARFQQWKAEDPQPLCALVGPEIGHPGTPDAETRVMLTECNVNYDQDGEFSPEISAEAQQSSNINLSHLKFEDRSDYRNKKLFTIDMSDTNDLECGFTLDKNSDGTVTVGVHVVDVSYFVPKDGNIDKEARFRGCTVSLVQKNLPMLPRVLSENICSLNPGKDRLAFSVMFKLTRDGKLIESEKPQFKKTLVRSCCKLDHKTAQLIIDHAPSSEEGLPDELKEPLFGVMRPEGERVIDLINDVLLLHDLGVARRKIRFTNEGALSLKHIKLKFQLDNQQQPIGFEPVANTPSHVAVEEMKLLANRFVAELLVAKAPDTALLLRQGPPDKMRLDKVVQILRNMGVGLQTGSAGLMQSSLDHFSNTQYRGNAKIALEKLCLAPMQKAQYYCPGQVAIDKQIAQQAAQSYAKLISAAPLPSSTSIATTTTKTDTAATTSTAAATTAAPASTAVATTNTTGSSLSTTETKTQGGFRGVQDDMRHFTKNLSAYTHFTSPLRRYADLEVQRLLAWTFDTTQPLPRDVKTASEIADHCNFRYDWAKKAQELSSRIFLSIHLYHKHPQGLEEKGMIVEIASRSFKVLVFRLGLEHRVQLDEVECRDVKITNERILEIRHVDGTLEARQVFDEVTMLLFGSIEPPCQVRFLVKPRQPITALNPRGNLFSPRPVLIPSGGSSGNSSASDAVAAAAAAAAVMFPPPGFGGFSPRALSGGRQFSLGRELSLGREMSAGLLPLSAQLSGGMQIPQMGSPRLTNHNNRSRGVSSGLPTAQHQQHEDMKSPHRNNNNNNNNRGSQNKGDQQPHQQQQQQNQQQQLRNNSKTPRANNGQNEENKAARPNVVSPKGDLASPNNANKNKPKTPVGSTRPPPGFSSPANKNIPTATTSQNQSGVVGQQNAGKPEPSPRQQKQGKAITPKSTTPVSGSVVSGVPKLASPQNNNAKKGNNKDKTLPRTSSSGPPEITTESSTSNLEGTTPVGGSRPSTVLSATSAVFSPSAASHATTPRVTPRTPLADGKSEKSQKKADKAAKDQERQSASRDDIVLPVEPSGHSVMNVAAIPIQQSQSSDKSEAVAETPKGVAKKAEKAAKKAEKARAAAAPAPELLQPANESTGERIVTAIALQPSQAGSETPKTAAKKAEKAAKKAEKAATKEREKQTSATAQSQSSTSSQPASSEAATIRVVSAIPIQQSAQSDDHAKGAITPVGTVGETPKPAAKRAANSKSQTSDLTSSQTANASVLAPASAISQTNTSTNQNLETVAVLRPSVAAPTAEIKAFQAEPSLTVVASDASTPAAPLTKTAKKKAKAATRSASTNSQTSAETPDVQPTSASQSSSSVTTEAGSSAS